MFSIRPVIGKVVAHLGEDRGINLRRWAVHCEHLGSMLVDSVMSRAQNSRLAISTCWTLD
jgi:hypothetical protein